MSSSLSIAWTKHLPEGKKQDFERTVRNSTLVLSRLRDICNEYEANISKQQTREEDFESPAWAYKEAYRNGKRAALRDIKDLLKFLDG